MTLGLSPYLLTSRSRINSWILRLMLLTGNKIAGICWGHNKQFFIPDDDGKFYYDFEYEKNKYKIPLEPFERGEKESIHIYETLNSYEPDVLITVGDLGDFTYMHAVKSFFTKTIKWLHVQLGYNYPINENIAEIISDIDGILCISKFSYDNLSKFYKRDLIDYRYAGCNTKFYTLGSAKCDKLTIMSCAKTSQSDCAPTLIEAVSDLKNTIADIFLYVHANIYDPGDHDLVSLRNRFNPQEDYISFPAEYVSLLEGVGEEKMCELFRQAQIFVSIPMICATSMSVFQALACGCYPLLSDVGTNRDIATNLAKFLGDFQPEDFLIPTIEVMAAGETYLHICGKEAVKSKIIYANEILKKHKGLPQRLSEFTLQYSQSGFLEKVLQMTKTVFATKPRLQLETV